MTRAPSDDSRQSTDDDTAFTATPLYKKWEAFIESYVGQMIESAGLEHKSGAWYIMQAFHLMLKKALAAARRGVEPSTIDLDGVIEEELRTYSGLTHHGSYYVRFKEHDLDYAVESNMFRSVKWLQEHLARGDNPSNTFMRDAFSSIVENMCDEFRRDAYGVEAVRQLDAADARSLLSGVADHGHLGSLLRDLAARADLRDAKVLRTLVELGADVTAADDDGLTAIHHAAMSGAAAGVAELLACGADVHAALRDGAVAATQEGTRPRKVDTYTPLHLAAGWNEDPAVTRALIRYGAPVDAPLSGSYEQGFTPLLLALQMNANPKVLHALIEAGADIHARPSPSSAPAILIAAGSDLAKFSLLLEAGADPRARDEEGNDCLHFAIMSGDPELVRRVGELGIVPEQRQHDGLTPLHWWLECASMTPHPDDVRLRMTRALLALGADVDARDAEGKSALHRAADAQDPVIAQALVDGGADLQARDNDGATALSRIIRNLLTIRLKPLPSTADEPLVTAARGDGTDTPPRRPAPVDPSATRISPSASAAGPFAIHVDVYPEVTYAFAHNRVPIVRSLAVGLTDGPPRGLLDVMVRLVWSREAKMPAKDVRFTIECPAAGGLPVVIEDVGLRLDDTVMVDLEEAVPAQVEVSVRAVDGTEQVATHAVRLLARNQWFFRRDYPELLAAFVQPNHPMVREINADAAKRLKAATGSASLEGYQSGPQRARDIGAAVFAALQARGLRYVNPPASFEASQKVRPLDEVLEGGAGTCIDLACAYASCLQAAGLHPLIWLVEGHAFGGFHTETEYLDASAIHDPSSMITMRDAGLAVPVETVALTDATTFDGAVAATRARYVPSALLMMLDVERAHRSGTLPLPARVVRGDVVEIVIDPGPDRAVIYERRDLSSGRRVATTAPPRVERWKSRLLDLSKRNPLVKFSTKRSGLDLLVPTGLLASIEDDLNGGRGIVLLAGDRLEGADSAAGLRSAADVHQDELIRRYRGLGTLYAPAGDDEGRRRLRSILTRARLIESETGANSLYLVLGTLTWRDKEGDELVSPLFLLPVRLQADRGLALARMSIDGTGFTSPNYCLVEKLKATHRLEVPELENPPEDDSGIDMEAVLTALRRAIHERRLPFRVDETAHLAVLQFSKFRLWKDMVDHWEAFARNPVVQHLIDRPGHRFQDPTGSNADDRQPAELTTACPLPSDGTQLRAIQRAASGQSFVIEGPPGTGKSQTIANLLANALAQGRRVLFVAEKQAALSVVKRRLVQVGLDPYCLDLHDKGSSHEDIRRQLRDALEHRPHADTREFARNDQALDNLCSRLAGYHAALYDENGVGESYATAHEQLVRLGAGTTAVVPQAFLEATTDTLQQVGRTAMALETSSRVAQAGPDHPWRIVRDLRFDDLDRPALATAIAELETVLGRLAPLPDAMQQALRATTSVSGFKALANQIYLQASQRLTPSDLDEAGRSGWWGRVDQALTSLSKEVQQATGALGDDGLTLLEMDEAAFSAAASAVEAASRSFFLGRRARVANALTSLVEPHRAKPMKVAEAVQLLAAARRHRGRFATICRDLHSDAGFLVSRTPSLARATNLDAFRSLAALSRSVAKRRAQTTPESVALRHLSESDSTGWTRSMATSVRDLAGVLGRVWGLLGITDDDVLACVGSGPLLDWLQTVVPSWRTDGAENRFLRLQRWATMLDDLRVLRAAGLDTFADVIANGEVQADEVATALQRGILTASLKERAEAHQLDTFDRHQHEANVTRFVEALERRREHLTHVIPARLADARTIDPDVGFGAVAELRVELQRQRGARSIRRLMERFGSIIQQLTQCFLMSPDSVAKFLPPGSIEFDMVVFDEASQIEVSEAIGAMGRATSVVVVGDSKQMPPSRFGDGVSDDDWGSEDDATDDAESLLIEAVEAGMDREWLAWHYRSRDESLIAFSNAHYYEGRLSSFPTPGGRNQPALTWRNVHGQFDHGGRRINAIEAQAVVDEVVRRLSESPETSLGVVTLNIQQRNEILERLEALGDPAITDLLASDQLESMFVRNLENVQGDERDVIILTTGYSRTRDGGPMPLRFGPLNRVGGERRLNVAITRARQEVVVISSFEPEEIDDRRAKALGLVHLREFLRTARDGARPIGEATAPIARPSAHRDEIADALRARGLRVGVDVGLSPFRVDLALSRHDEPGWCVAVLLDGWRWRDRVTVGDRDALPITVLERDMGWPRVARVWTPAWRDEAQAIVDDLVNLVDAAVAEGSMFYGAAKASPGATREAASTDVSHGHPIAPAHPAAFSDVASTKSAGAAGAPSDPPPTPTQRADARESGPRRDEAVTPAIDQVRRLGATPFVAYPDHPRLGAPADCDPDRLGSTRLRRAVAEALEWESPVEASRLARLVSRRFGVEKLHAKRADHILRFLPKGATTCRSEHGHYVWAPGHDPAAYADFRIHVHAADSRKLDEVAPEELANLLHAIVRAAGHIESVDLQRTALAALSIVRLTTGVRQRLEAMVDAACRTARLQRDDDGRVALGANHVRHPVAAAAPRPAAPPRAARSTAVSGPTTGSQRKRSPAPNPTTPATRSSERLRASTPLVNTSSSRPSGHHPPHAAAGPELVGAAATQRSRRMPASEIAFGDAAIPPADLDLDRIADVASKHGIPLVPGPPAAFKSYVIHGSSGSHTITLLSDNGLEADGAARACLRVASATRLDSDVTELDRLDLVDRLNREFGFVAFSATHDSLNAVYDIPLGGGLMESDVAESLAVFRSVTEAAFAAVGARA